MPSLEALPGGDFVAAGLHDLERGEISVGALLVSIGAPRLRTLGIAISRVEVDPEHRLYAVLHAAAPDAAHSRYNALIRRLVSFERALACVLADEPRIRRFMREFGRAARGAGKR